MIRSAKAFALFALSLLLAMACLAARAQQADSAQQAAQPAGAPPPGKKLILTDGTFQMVREYKIEGDRVRYYSLEQSQWEEIPFGMVDWNATKKAEVTQKEDREAELSRLREEEKARSSAPVDVDASVEVAPGVFLPPGEGIFVLDGTSVFPLSQAETDIRMNKTQLLKQVLVPIPIIPTRHSISLKGAHAKFRVTNSQPEFYMRTADAREPDLDLIHAHVHGDKRQIENLDTLFTQETAKRSAVAIERWQLVKGVYRFTLSQPLAPGEYAFGEIVPGEGMNLYVWDFGVDGTAPKKK